MSIVLVIVGTVVTGVIMYLSLTLKQRAGEETKYKLQVLQQTLLDYRLAFNRIPCPADLTLATTDQNFGAEAANRGDCTGGSPAANFAGGNDVEGMVPTKTLGLPDDFAFDGWGHRIDYAVDVDFTADDAFSTIAASDATARMTVKDSSAGTDKTTAAAYVLISFGPDGHGAFPRGASATPISSGSTNTDEQNNCDCDNSAGVTGLDGVFVQKEPTRNPSDLSDVFDDMVLYATRSDLRSELE
jgi:hypothetical protein